MWGGGVSNCMKLYSLLGFACPLTLFSVKSRAMSCWVSTSFSSSSLKAPFITPAISQIQIYIIQIIALPIHLVQCRTNYMQSYTYIVYIISIMPILVTFLKIQEKNFASFNNIYYVPFFFLFFFPFHFFNFQELPESLETDKKVCSNPTIK